MADGSALSLGKALLPPIRPEIELPQIQTGPIGDVERRLPAIARIADNPFARRLAVLIVLGAVWQAYAVHVDNDLLLPRLSDVIVALIHDVVSGEILGRIWTTLQVLVMGYASGILLAGLLTVVASSTRLGSDVLSTVTAMFNPLPAIALLPLALLWFGFSNISLIFVIVHSVLWAVALNTHTGFQSVSETLRMAGRNFGLRGLSFVARILIPAALPSIVAGLKIGWAFAWRTLIAAELVFGASSGRGGLGWYIFENRNNLETVNVFAGLLCVILIGLAVESLIFRTIEIRTLRRWGMQR